MAGKKGATHYPRELKERAVHLALDEGWSYQAVTRELEIRDPGRVKKWVRAYRREGTAAFMIPTGRPRKTVSEQDELARLRMENDLLKKFHTELRNLRLAKRNIG